MCECFHASLVDALSQSHDVELIFGSCIQSHWPCMTLCPISMFSRILAIPSTPVPSSQAGLYREPSRDGAAQQRELAVQGDDAADVLRVLVAEAVEHLIVDGVELGADLLDLLRRQL